MNDVKERLHSLHCPKCGTNDRLQLEETALFVTPLVANDEGKPPYLEYDDGETHYSECGITELKTGGTHQIACYHSTCAGFSWKAPQWVLDALEQNTLSERERLVKELDEAARDE